jgi:selenocysteine lyase/cysteine desulfurase
MDVTRRDFLGMTAGAALLPLQPNATAVNDDPLGVRKDFPALDDYTFLNTAYTGLISRAVVDAAREWTSTRAGRTYTVGEMLAKTDEARALYADMIGAGADEIAFLSSTSEGENIVVNSLDFKPGDNVVYDDLVYPSTPIIYERLARARGVEIRVAKSRNGAVPLEEFSRLADKRTRLISVAWVNHNSGFRHDMKALAAIAHSRGAYLYSDAVQFIGSGPVDIHAEGVDFCTSGTYKWIMAGFGVAPFYVRRELLNTLHPPNVGWRTRPADNKSEAPSAARTFEYATPAFGELYELAAALKYLRSIGLDRIEARSQALVRRFRSGLAARKIQIDTPENNRSSIVSFYTRRPAADAEKILQAERVKVSLQAAGALTRVRVSFAFFNNEADVDRMLAVAAQISESSM